MRRLIRIAVAALLAGLMLARTPALADHRHHERSRDWDRPEGEWRGARPAPWGYGPPPQAYGPPGPAYAPFPPPIYPRRLPPPGYGVRRGGLIPPQYRGAVVPDYRRYRLRPPPPGFVWVRMGGRYMLVSRATGQIFDVIGE